MLVQERNSTAVIQNQRPGHGQGTLDTSGRRGRAAQPITQCEHTDRKHFSAGMCQSCWQKLYYDRADADARYEHGKSQKRKDAYEKGAKDVFRKRLFARKKVVAEMMARMLANGECLNPSALVRECRERFKGATTEEVNTIIQQAAIYMAEHELDKRLAEEKEKEMVGASS